MLWAMSRAGLQFTHVAGAHAGVVIRQMLFGLPAKQAVIVPTVTYTDPELAQIGLTEADARARHPDVQVLRQEFLHNDRAVTDGKTAGFLKLMLVKGRPVGVTIVGAGAGELIGLWALAITCGPEGRGAGCDDRALSDAWRDFQACSRGLFLAETL